MLHLHRDCHNLTVTGITGRFLSKTGNREGLVCSKKLKVIIKLTVPFNNTIMEQQNVKHQVAIAELCLPYKGAIITNEVVEVLANNFTNYSHPQRPSAIIAP